MLTFPVFRVTKLVKYFLFFLFSSALVPAFGTSLLLSPLPEASRQDMWRQGSPALQDILENRATESVILTRAMPSYVAQASEQIELMLEQGLSVTAQKFQFEQTAAGIAVWHGRFPDLRSAAATTPQEVPVDEANAVILVRNGEKITGSARFEGQLYKIIPIGSNQHAVVKTDENRIPGDAPVNADQPIPDTNATLAAPQAVQGASSTIRVMFVMSNGANTRIEDPAGLVALMIAEANQGYRNSGISLQLESAGIFHVNYNEQSGSDGFSAMLSRLRNTSDPVLGAPTHLLREANKAYTVVMLVTNGAYGGMAYRPASKTSAFALVGVSYATGNYTFAHEVGHNIGAGHGGSGGAIPYAHGYHQDRTKPYWRTVMSGSCSNVSCPRLNYWSSPNRSYNGLPMGTTGNSDNTRVLNERRDLVANFYPPFVGAQLILSNKEKDTTARLTLPTLGKGSRAGVVTLSADEGPTQLEYAPTGYTRLTVGVKDSTGREHQVWLRGQRSIGECGRRAMHAYVACASGSSLFLTLQYLEEDNLSLPEGKYYGALKLEARDQKSPNWVAPITVSIVVSRFAVPVTLSNGSSSGDTKEKVSFATLGQGI